MNKLEGIVYKTQSYKESSRLLQVFTKKGKITINARGSQRINSNDRILAQYLNLISFEYKEYKSFINLYNGKLINDFKTIKEDYEKVKLVSTVLELIDKTIIDNEYNEKIYNLLIETINYKDINKSVLSFCIKLLYYLGYGLNLTPEKENVKGISIEKGGLVYKDEYYSIDLNQNQSITFLKLTHYKTKDLDKIEDEYLKEIRFFIYKYYLDKLDINLKQLI